MKPLFVKDPYRAEWDSKTDRLSLAIAARIGGAYWVDGCSGPCIVHAADGVCSVPKGCIPSVIVYHDDMKYPVFPLARKIGLGNIQGCPENLAGYPLDAADMARLPESVEYDAVVGGRVNKCSCDAIGTAGLDGLRVAVALTGDADTVAAICNEVGRRAASVMRFDGISLPTVSALYRTCRTVVHLGDCKCGYLHSLAMYHTDAPGRRLTERMPGERFAPPSMEEFVRLFEKR